MTTRKLNITEKTTDTHSTQYRFKLKPTKDGTHILSCDPHDRHHDRQRGRDTGWMWMDEYFCCALTTIQLEKLRDWITTYLTRATNPNA